LLVKYWVCSIYDNTQSIFTYTVHDNDEVADTVAIVATDIAGNEAERLIAVSVKENLVRGFVINGENANDKSGHSVSTAGDVNGDGLDDVIVGAFDANLSSKSKAGKSYVAFGTTVIIRILAINDKAPCATGNSR
jgi:hypothetical protein